MTERLEAKLGLYGVFAVSVGAMIGSGIFVLPGLAAKIAGPAVVLAYFLAGLVIFPAGFSKSEMATAMPEAGGTYLYIDRAMGPLMGTIAGVGVWFSIVFKAAFALVGLGAYLSLFENLPERPVALALGVVLILINVAGAKTSSSFQSFLIALVLGVLAVFVLRGAGSVNAAEFQPFMPHGIKGLLSATGLVFVSFIGVTKVASIAEEVRRPEFNLPAGILLSISLMVIVYPLIAWVMVGTAGTEALSATVTPMTTAAEQFMGPLGVDIVTVVAIVALISMANAGVLASSRYPFAMARRALAPPFLAKVSSRNTPLASTLVTGAVLLALIAFVPLLELAKLASAFQLIVFSLVNLAVIAFREGNLDWYQPSFKSPLYPWTQLFGIAGSLILLTQMGMIPMIGAILIVAGGVLWYRAFGRSRASRESASLDALRIRDTERLVTMTEQALARPGADHVLVLSWRGMKRRRLREILQIAADLTRAGGRIDISRVDRGGSGGTREEQAWALEIEAIAKKVGVQLSEIIPCAIREDHQKRINESDIDLLLAEMPSDIRENKPFVRDLRWLRDNAECDTILFRNRGLEKIETIVIMGSGGPYDVLKISLADRIAQREHASIRFVHVVNEDATEAQLASIKEYHDHLHTMITLPTESRIEPAEELVDTLARLSRGANLVVIGAVASRFRLFADLADRITEMMDAPALVVYANLSARKTRLSRIIEYFIY
ncbi:MAG: amino acid permease [Acidimicrobiia bacterium]|nr:amino acid permease [Acidimicrobiia bacterium]